MALMYAAKHDNIVDTWTVSAVTPKLPIIHATRSGITHTSVGVVPQIEDDSDVDIPNWQDASYVIPTVRVDSSEDPNFLFSAGVVIQVPKFAVSLLQPFIGHSFTGIITFSVSVYNTESMSPVSGEAFDVSIDFTQMFSLLYTSSITPLGPLQGRNYYRLVVNGILSHVPPFRLKCRIGPTHRSRLAFGRYSITCGFEFNGAFLDTHFTAEVETSQPSWGLLHPESPDGGGGEPFVFA